MIVVVCTCSREGSLLVRGRQAKTMFHINMYRSDVGLLPGMMCEDRPKLGSLVSSFRTAKETRHDTLLSLLNIMTA